MTRQKLHCSFSKPFPKSSTARPKFLKSNLVSDLFMDIKTLLDNLHDEISCSVCKCAFTDPKQLPCLHSFCLHCLNGIQRTSGGHGKITCPECKRQFQFVTGKTRNIDIAISRFAANSPGAGVLLYISEHKSVCYSFVTRMSVHKYSNNFSSPCFSLPSQLFRTNSSFLLSPNFLDHAPRAHTFNSRKYRMFIIIPSNHQNMSRNTI